MVPRVYVMQALRSILDDYNRPGAKRSGQPTAASHTSHKRAAGAGASSSAAADPPASGHGRLPVLTQHKRSKYTRTDQRVLDSNDHTQRDVVSRLRVASQQAAAATSSKRAVRRKARAGAATRGLRAGSEDSDTELPVSWVSSSDGDGVRGAEHVQPARAQRAPVKIVDRCDDGAAASD
jgi:hypothetical protein